MALMLRDKNSNFINMGRSKDTLRYVFDDKQITCVFREVLYTSICCESYASYLGNHLESLKLRQHQY